jgi:uncharacterized protein YukE
VAQQFTTDEATMAAAVRSFDACAQAISNTLSGMERTVSALHASNYQGKQRQAFDMVEADLRKQTQEVRSALGLDGLGGMVRSASSAYQNLDQTSAAEFNKVAGGAVFNRLVG